TTGYKELVAVMGQHGISALPVIDIAEREGRLVGIVTETDLLARERAEGERKAAASVAHDLMTSPVMTVRPDDTLARAARLMHRAHVRHLAVVDVGTDWWESSVGATC